MTLKIAILSALIVEGLTFANYGNYDWGGGWPGYYWDPAAMPGHQPTVKPTPSPVWDGEKWTSYSSHLC